ncbi:hypothetical protein AKJ09_04276 [Labilithrix luteola]|uniref:DUF3592 domain-containing protein n=1 Tax=Labilithrix luteola TaxID=1391654 RepID=A0A0K1PVQ8_9BACT|nr:DUF3592 domain-containing protein [Labilithrix luteola]AKU97612.1 hypothetical protein AKJ09_04276 [Labilithrix luteola]
MLSLLAELWFLVGLCLWTLGSLGNADAERQESWPKTKGMVAEGHVLEVPGQEGDVGPWFVGVVRYVFDDEPESTLAPYRSRPSLEGKLESPISLRRSSAEELVASYPVGMPIDVRYDPEHPSKSIVGAPLQSSFSRWLCAAGLAIAGLAFPVAYFL